MKTLLLGPWPYPENNWQRAGAARYDYGPKT